MVIGQETLKNDLLRILEIFKTSKAAIRPHFILTGPSGSGKSMIIEYLCGYLDLPLLQINAAQLTKEGTSGNSLSKALSPVSNMSSKPSVVFVDEFDKLFISGNSNSELAHEITNGVQNEFLKVLESEVTSVFGDYGKYRNVKANNLLFVFAGAFNGEPNITVDRLREFGVKTEFIGRVGLVYNTSPLSIDSLFQILDNSDLLDTYLRLFSKDKDEVVPILKQYLEKTFENNTIGARLINTLIHQYFIKGKLPSEEVEKISFTETMNFD